MNHVPLTSFDKLNIRNAVRTQSFSNCIANTSYSKELQDFIISGHTNLPLKPLKQEFLAGHDAFNNVPMHHIMEFLSECNLPFSSGKDQFQVIKDQQKVLYTIVYHYVSVLFQRQKEQIKLQKLLTRDKVQQVLSK